MPFDRLLEYVNLLQQQRMNAFSGFDSALHQTDLLPAMLHVDHAYEEAVHGSSPTEEVMTRSELFSARSLQDLFLSKCGSDLTIASNSNPFWHTGNATSFSGGDYREQQPWEYIWRVAQGLAVGRGRSSMQSDVEFVMDFLRDHCFHM